MVLISQKKLHLPAIAGAASPPVTARTAPVSTATVPILSDRGKDSGGGNKIKVHEAKIITNYKEQYLLSSN